MPMNKDQAEKTLTQMIPAVSKAFYGGKPFTIFDGAITVVPKIIVEEKAGVPNGNITGITDTTYGVLVNRAFLAIKNDVALKFALAHELGHGFTAVALEKLDKSMKGISGPRTEIVADLGAAYLCAQTGIKWEDVDKAVKDWKAAQIFDEKWEGDHPPGAVRAQLVGILCERMKIKGADFMQAAKEMLVNLASYKQNDAQLPKAFKLV